MSYDIMDVAIAGARKMAQLAFVANNIANTSTTGFKSEYLHYVTKGKPAQESARFDLGPTTTVMDFAQGTSQGTGRSLDMAIEGEGFFTIEKKTGTAYTRNGSFVLNKNKELVNQSGEYVSSESGRIVVNGNFVEVDAEGNIIADGNVVGKVKVVSFANPGKLTRISGGQYIDEGNAGLTKAEKYRVAGGYLELSNVNAAKEMINMIEIQRSFETYQKIILTLTDLDKVSTSRIGKLT